MLDDPDFRQLLDASPDAVLLVDARGRIVGLNVVAEKLFGTSRDALLGRRVETLVPPRLRRAHVAHREAFTAVPAVRPMSIRHRLVAIRADNIEIPVEISLIPLIGDAAGTVMAIVRDVGDRVRMEAALYTEKEWAQVTLASIADGVITTDAAGRAEYLNAAAEALLGWTAEEARGRRLGEILPLRDEVTGAVADAPWCHGHTLVWRDGRRIPIEHSKAPVRNRVGQTIGSVVVFRDATRQRELTSRLLYEATHDALTGLVNRAEFERRLERVLLSAKEEHSRHALCYIDLDGFKVVNDTFGHGAGDELLRQLSEALHLRVRHRDTLARLGGDEFGLLLGHCLPKRAQRLVAVLQRAIAGFLFCWEGRTLQIGASVGVVELDETSGTTEEVLRAADAACYAAKRQRYRVDASR